MKSIVDIYVFVFALVIMISVSCFTYADNVEIQLGSGDGFKVLDSGGSPLMDILSNGYVGIGTSPNYELDVSGDINFTGSLYQNGTIYGGSSGSGDGHSLDAADGDPTDSIYVDNDGNVGIGTTSPSYKLHVYSGASGGTAYSTSDLIIEDSSRATLQFLSPNSQSNAIYFGDSDSSTSGQIFYNHADDSLGFSTPSGRTLTITSGNVGIGMRSPSERLYVSGNIYATGTVSWGSSRELKEDIRELTSEEALAALTDLTPTRYRYKADNEDEHIGFIAEDVPDLVASKDRKSLSPMDIVAVLTKVVQRQQTENQALKDRLTRIEALLNGRQ